VVVCGWDCAVLRDANLWELWMDGYCAYGGVEGHGIEGARSRSGVFLLVWRGG